MKYHRIIIFLSALFLSVAVFAAGSKPRVIVLTDIENEPDDAMSMVRFLTYCNQWDVEGLVATTSVHQKNQVAAWRIREIVDAYAKVQGNLLKHEPGFPTADYLRSVIKEGRPDYGMHAVGNGMDSEGSELIIHAVDKKDDRPVWVLVWGGPNCLAQALWKVRQTRSEAELERFVKKLRVYAISDQDDSGPWIRHTFKNLFYIVSPGYHPFGGYHYATWSGISGDHFHGRFAGADFSIVDNPWLDENIRCKGPLGAQYPKMKFLMEGDTPTFLYLIDNGLGDAEHPDWGSWGGRYEYYQPGMKKWFLEPETRPIWTDAMDEVMGNDGNWHTTNKATIWRWRTAYQNDFAARMDWTITDYRHANHPPVVKLSCEPTITAHVGDTIRLSAKGSEDPDGNQLSYQWFYYPEAGTMCISSARTGNPLTIEDADKAKAWFVVPRTERYGTMHMIVAVTDNGTPALTRYKRVIVDVVSGQRESTAVNQTSGNERYRVLISSDIGGTDPDDNQSMAHLLMNNDRFDLEGLVSSPSFGEGNKEEILRMIDVYEKDRDALSKHVSGLMSAADLRKLVKQGRKGEAPACGYDRPTEGSDWIVKQARREDSCPLYVLVWGCLDDVAQALHDAPDIAPKLRVHWIGGPNKKWGVNAYCYIVQNFPDLWMIENNTTYRGFIYDSKNKDTYNMGYFNSFIKDAGYLGRDFAAYYKGNPKMGDTPSLLYMMKGNPAHPEQQSWAGRFERCSYTPHTVFYGATTAHDTVPINSIIEWSLQGPALQDVAVDSACITLTIRNQQWRGYYKGNGLYVLRHSTYYTGTLPYIITSTVPGFKTIKGEITVENTWKTHRSTDYPVGSNWFTDSYQPDDYWHNCAGAATQQRVRQEAMEDWAERWKWLKKE